MFGQALCSVGKIYPMRKAKQIENRRLQCVCEALQIRGSKDSSDVSSRFERILPYLCSLK